MKTLVLVEMVGGVVSGVMAFPAGANGRDRARAALRAKVVSYLSEEMAANEAAAAADVALADGPGFCCPDAWSSGDGETDLAIHEAESDGGETELTVATSAIWEAVDRFMANNSPDHCAEQAAMGPAAGATLAAHAAGQKTVADLMAALAGQKKITTLMAALAAAKEALLNVPMVGEEYDQQHSDTHMRATLLIDDALAAAKGVTAA